MPSQVKSYTFVLVLSGFSKVTGAIEDALYEGGCDDALLYVKDGVPYLEFERSADSFEKAVYSAIKDVENSIEATVVRLEPGDTVNAAEAARRLECSREYVRKLRTSGGKENVFPAPIAGIATRTMIWSWAEIAEFLYRAKKIKDSELVQIAKLSRDINVALNMRADKDRRGSVEAILAKIS